MHIRMHTCISARPSFSLCVSVLFVIVGRFRLKLVASIVVAFCLCSMSRTTWNRVWQSGGSSWLCESEQGRSRSDREDARPGSVSGSSWQHEHRSVTVTHDSWQEVHRESGSEVHRVGSASEKNERPER